MSEKTIEDVRSFWESNPLFADESIAEVGSKQYFEEHKRIIIEDCLAGELDPRTLPSGMSNEHILDLGCGPGFWTIELSLNGARKITSADLTNQAVKIVKMRAAPLPASAQYTRFIPPVSREAARSELKE